MKLDFEKIEFQNRDILLNFFLKKGKMLESPKAKVVIVALLLKKSKRNIKRGREMLIVGRGSFRNFFSRWSLRNLNYIKSNKKLISYIDPKKKKKNTNK